MTQTIDIAMKQLTRASETIKRNEVQRFPEAASIGDAVRQGDLLITLIGVIPAEDVVKIQKPLTKLAPGSTQGSRHCLDSLEGVEVFTLRMPGALDGPLLRLKQERTLTHPEHSHIILPPGMYAVTYQRVESVKRQVQRAQD